MRPAKRIAFLLRQTPHDCLQRHTHDKAELYIKGYSVPKMPYMDKHNGHKTSPINSSTKKEVVAS